jgi:hypothetical protein
MQATLKDMLMGPPAEHKDKQEKEPEKGEEDRAVFGQPGVKLWKHLPFFPPEPEQTVRDSPAQLLISVWEVTDPDSVCGKLSPDAKPKTGSLAALVLHSAFAEFGAAEKASKAGGGTGSPNEEKERDHH